MSGLLLRGVALGCIGPDTHLKRSLTGLVASADNIWALKSYCAKAFEGNGTDIDAFFKQTGYTPDMDYL